MGNPFEENKATTTSNTQDHEVRIYAITVTDNNTNECRFISAMFNLVQYQRANEWNV